MKCAINGLAVFLLQCLISNFCLLTIGATSDFDIINAPGPNEIDEWQLYDPNEHVHPSVEIDVPLRFEIKPTPVALGMGRSEFYNQGDDDYLQVNRDDIQPNKVIPNIEMTAYRHRQKRQNDGNTEGSGTASCSTLGAPTNGQLNDTCQSQTSGCVLIFSCNEGYTLQGESQLTCGDDGSWSSNPPECRVNACPALSNPANGQVSYPCRFENCVVQYTCGTGYQITGSSSSLTCTLVNGVGTWNGNPPTCTIVDCGDPNIASSSFTGSTTFGSSITVTCDTDYTLLGPTQVTCLANGSWNETQTCLYVCGAPSVGNAMTSQNCTTLGCATNIECNEGYSLVGSANSTCTDTGWSYLPTCVENTRTRSTNTLVITITFIVRTQVEQRFLRGNDMSTVLSNFYQNSRALANNAVAVRILNALFFPNYPFSRRKRQDGGTSGFPQYVQLTYSVLVNDQDSSKGSFAATHADLLRDKTLTIAGREVAINRTGLFGLIFESSPENVRNGSEDFNGYQDVSCQIYEVQINGCPEGTVCRTSGSELIASCVTPDDGSGDTDDDDYALKVGLGVGIPLFLLLCALLGCCCYWLILARKRQRRRRHKRRTYVPENESSSSATMSGFSPGRLPMALDTVGRRGPMYGTQFPELWDASESVVEAYDDSPQPQRRGSFPYVVSVGHEEQRPPYTSNFSWDFMYRYVDKDLSLPRPRL